jgi:hypothetical protein
VETGQSLGQPIRAGEWLYDGRISLAVRLFRGDTLWGSGDEEDAPEVRDDQVIECYYLQLQVAGDERFGSWRTFLALDDVERFGRDQLRNSLRYDK